jgi:hypothetical protein
MRAAGGPSAAGDAVSQRGADAQVFSLALAPVTVRRFGATMSVFF